MARSWYSRRVGRPGTSSSRVTQASARSALLAAELRFSSDRDGTRSLAAGSHCRLETRALVGSRAVAYQGASCPPVLANPGAVLSRRRRGLAVVACHDGGRGRGDRRRNRNLRSLWLGRGRKHSGGPRPDRARGHHSPIGARDQMARASFGSQAEPPDALRREVGRLQQEVLVDLSRDRLGSRVAPCLVMPCPRHGGCPCVFVTHELAPWAAVVPARDGVRATAPLRVRDIRRLLARHRRPGVSIGRVQRRAPKPAKALPRAALRLSGATPEVPRNHASPRMTARALERTSRHARRDSLGRAAARS